ncbi:nitroreductase family protein [soil metagenome]
MDRCGWAAYKQYRTPKAIPLTKIISTSRPSAPGRRAFIRIAGGGVIVAATAGLTGCGTSMPASAIQAWQGPGAEADLRRWLLGYAILAPHSHNLQSWQVDLATPGEITLRCDLSRLLPETDPYARQIMMSHGTFLELLDLAARERGLRAGISLFPEGAFDAVKIDHRPVARITLTPDTSVRPDPLFAQILQRRTNRSAYDLQRPVPAEAWSAMARSAAEVAVVGPAEGAAGVLAEGAAGVAAGAARPTGLRFGFVGADQPAALQQHRAIAAQAWRAELETPRVMMEAYRVLRVGTAEIAAHGDGLYVLDPMVVALARVGLFDRSQAPAAGDYATTSQITDFGKKLDSTPGFLWMVTAGNDRAAQVEAGRAYARVQLAATAHGLAMQPLQQALQEYPEQAGAHAAIGRLLDAPAPQTVQMWARVGYAPPVGPAPRRGVAAQISNG